MPRLFLDMDGTLTQFFPATTEKLNTPGYFLALPPHDNVVMAARLLLQNPSDWTVYVLSAVLDNPHAASEKKEWLVRHLPEIKQENILFTPCGSDKSCYVPAGIRQDDILLDDFSKNLHRWKGVGVKLRNSINGTHGTWKGHVVWYDWTPQHIIEKLIF